MNSLIVCIYNSVNTIYKQKSVRLIHNNVFNVKVQNTLITLNVISKIGVLEEEFWEHPV